MYFIIVNLISSKKTSS